MDSVISELRLIKSHYELALMRKSGSIHRNVLDELAPRFIVQGVSEAELADQGITPSTIRLSVGTEHIDDIIADLENGFAAIQ